MEHPAGHTLHRRVGVPTIYWQPQRYLLAPRPWQLAENHGGPAGCRLAVQLVGEVTLAEWEAKVMARVQHAWWTAPLQ